MSNAVLTPTLFSPVTRQSENRSDATENRLRAAAVALEASFLAEMLKSAEVGKTPDSFGGGAGEDQFNSFLTEAYGDMLAQRGGIGLAESLFNALKARQ